jgi:hypothetical protein
MEGDAHRGTSIDHLLIADWACPIAQSIPVRLVGLHRDPKPLRGGIERFIDAGSVAVNDDDVTVSAIP